MFALQSEQLTCPKFRVLQNTLQSRHNRVDRRVEPFDCGSLNPSQLDRVLFISISTSPNPAIMSKKANIDRCYGEKRDFHMIQTKINIFGENNSPNIDGELFNLHISLRCLTRVALSTMKCCMYRTKKKSSNKLKTFAQLQMSSRGRFNYLIDFLHINNLRSFPLRKNEKVQSEKSVEK